MKLEKQREAQNTIKKLIDYDKEITDQTHISECKNINFLKTFFTKKKTKLKVL